MIKLHVALWKLLAYGAALFLLAVFRIRGQSLKHSLSRERVTE